MSSSLAAQFEEPVVALDDEQRVVGINGTAARFLGVRPEAVMGAACHEAIRAHDARTGLPCAVDCPVFRSGEYEWAHSRWLVPDGERRPRQGVECLLFRCAGRRDATLVFLGSERPAAPWAAPSAIEATHATRALLKVSDPQLAAQLVLDAALQATGAEAGEVRLAGPRSEAQAALRVAARGGGVVPDASALPEGAEEVARVQARVAEVREPALERFSGGASSDQASDLARGWLLCLPLLADDRLMGTITLLGRRGRFAVGTAIRSVFPLAAQLSAFLLWAERAGGSRSGARQRARIDVLGPFSITVDGRRVPPAAFRRRRGLELLKRLVATRSRSLGREEVSALLWPGRSAEAAGQSLRVLLHSLRRALEPELTAARPSAFIEVDAERISLAPDAVEVDVDEFLACHRQCGELAALGYTSQAVSAGRRAIELYRGPFFEDEVYSDWCVAQRAYLHEAFVDVVLQVGTLLSSAGDHGGAIDTYHRALLAEPAREEAHRALMLSLWRAGRPDEALRQYASCIAMLRDTLGAEPMPETVALRGAIVEAVRSA